MRAYTPRRLVLLVKFWLVEEEGKGTWIGQVTSLPDESSKQTFRSLPELNAFVEHQLDVLTSADATPAWEADE